MKIIADTATLFAPSEGEAQGLTIIPIDVSINNKSYKEYADISADEFLKHIQAGGIPSTSQPALGDMLDVFQSGDEEMLFLTLADGLSGAYQTALSARNCVQDPQRIHVINSKTLGGPLRYLAKKAAALNARGLSAEKIKEELAVSIESSVSFVIPEDFDFLRRSGRLTPITAKVGGALKLLPVLTQTEDKTRIKPVAIKRGWKSATHTIIQRLQAIGVDQDYLISVSHAGTYEKAVSVVNQIKEVFAATETEILSLSPGLMTHGGPGCIVVQAIRK